MVWRIVPSSNLIFLIAYKSKEMKVGDKMPAVVEGVIIENCNGTINVGDKYNVQPIEKTKAYNGSQS